MHLQESPTFAPHGAIQTSKLVPIISNVLKKKEESDIKLCGINIDSKVHKKVLVSKHLNMSCNVF